jgi:hypothetical protein
LCNITVSGTSGKIIVNTSGFYSIFYRVNVWRNTANHHLVTRLYKNNSSEIEASYSIGTVVGGDANEIQPATSMLIAYLEEGDYITLQAGINFIMNGIGYFDNADLPDPDTVVTAIVTLLKVG